MKALEEGKEVVCPSFRRTPFNIKGRKLICSQIDQGVIDIDADWELYEEPQKTYRFWELLDALKEAKSIKRKNWGKQIQIVRGHLCFADEGWSTSWESKLEDLEATDWVICDE